MTQESVSKNVYWLLLLAACMNVITYFVWKWIMGEEPSFITFISMQIVFNCLIGMNIVRMIKNIDSK